MILETSDIKHAACLLPVFPGGRGPSLGALHLVHVFLGGGGLGTCVEP